MDTSKRITMPKALMMFCHLHFPLRARTGQTTLVTNLKKHNNRNATPTYSNLEVRRINVVQQVAEVSARMKDQTMTPCKR